ncbi:iron ABC transporter permease [Hydrocarboniphaga effusa]|jgi:iron complex transport system permease protein|uniref:FecCD family ABC transporter permease n=2 Tax=Hydrocarboniphaga effusa TaxID=243629 RepID=UPI003137DDB6
MSAPSRLRSRLALMFLLAVAVVAAAMLGLCLGSSSIALSRVIGSLIPAIGVGLDPPPGAFEIGTVLQLRLPRVVLALLVGASLAQSGAAMQGLFRNPLADPGLIGVASGAAFGAALAILLGRQAPESMRIVSIPLAAFAGGLLSAALASGLARSDGHTRVTTLLLAGLAANALFAAGIGFIVSIADPSALRNISFWMFGSLAKSGWREIALIAPILIALLLWLPRQAHALNALQLGEAEARHLGIDVERLKRRVLAGVVLAVACCVALSGLIGFVGLLAPHWIRLWAGPDHRTVLPASALCGAALLATADVIARTSFAPQELPVGILTAVLGAPFFLILLMRHRNRVESW